MGPVAGSRRPEWRFVPPAMLPPGEPENPFDFLFGMGNISPDELCPRL